MGPGLVASGASKVRVIFSRLAPLSTGGDWVHAGVASDVSLYQNAIQTLPTLAPAERSSLRPTRDPSVTLALQL